MEFWDLIVKSNTFNFAILLLIFVILYQKLNVSKILEDMKQSIVNSIERAKSERDSADEKLKNAQKAVNNLASEIQDIKDSAQRQLKAFSDTAEQNAERQIKSINENIARTVRSEEKTIAQLASDNTLRKSTELAKERIIKMLKDNPKLHDKFIEESLGELQ